MPIYLSNDLETLFSQLKKEIFGKNRSLLNLPTISVASYGMKRWLKMQFAKEGVAVGLQITTLEKSLGKASTKYDIFIALYQALQEFEDVKEYAHNQKRQIHLAKLLSRNFYLYGIYGIEIEGWQKKLFELLKKKPYQIRFWKEAIEPIKKELHCFGFSYIPPLFFQHLEKASIYCLSPCKEFWSNDAMPLLMSLGQLGREMAKQLDGKETTPDYKFEIEEFTLFQALKLDLLFNKTEPPEVKEDFPIEDKSIELHEMPSQRREVEWVYEKLVELSRDPNFDPGKVLVVAKDIAPYVPYIKAVFENEKSLFDPLLFDQPKSDYNKAYQYFEDLIEFGTGRLEKHLYLKLVQDEQIADWIERGQILWGYDVEHRNALLKEAGCQERYGEEEGIGTWKKGFDLLLDGLLLDEEPKIREAESLGEWITQFEALQTDMQITRRVMPVTDWIEALELFVTKWVKGEEEELLELKAALQQIKPNLPFDPVLPFEIVHEKIQDVMNQKENVLGDLRLHAIAFSSLFPNRAIPKDTIFFLGAQRKDFPKYTEENSLNQLVGKTFFPTGKHDDRYAFLEGLLSAKKHLYLSYQKEKGVSSVVTELFDYLDKNFTVGGELPSKARFFKHLKEEEMGEAKGFLQPLKELELPATIELRDLESFARDPLRAYYQKGLQLRFHDTEAEVEETVETFTAKTRKELRALQLKSFRALGMREMDEQERLLSAYEKPTTLVFQRGLQEKLEGEVRLYPALQIGPVSIEGKLPNVTSHGLLVEEYEHEYGAWPKLLILGLLGYPTKLLYWKSGKEKEVPIDRPKERLEAYLRYYAEAIRRPSPGHPKVVKALLEKGHADAVKAMENLGSPYWDFDTYALSEEEFHYWQNNLRGIYG